MSIFQVGRSPIMTIKSHVLALKYRPQTFKDLIGHEEIATTIYNSIKNNNSANAFLFTGIRGIGKTTFARIVAKALNCEHSIEAMCKKKCNQCDPIANSNHIDVLEMDAASKTGVDDVRDLIEFSRYTTTVSKFKIFIIRNFLEIEFQRTFCSTITFKIVQYSSKKMRLVTFFFCIRCFFITLGKTKI